MQEIKNNKAIFCSFILIALLAVVIILNVIMASVPPVNRDELTHHLSIPKLYVKNGGMFEIPNVKFSYYPMNIDLLYIIPLYYGNDIFPKYIHMLFGILTACFIYKFLNEYEGRNYGLMGALFFLSTPIIIKLSITAYVDLGLVFFSWLSIYYILKWNDRKFDIQYLIYAGAACGLALGTKYNGLVTLFIIAGLTPLIYSLSVDDQMHGLSHLQQYRNSLRGLFYGGVFIMAALIVYSPWMIRNYLWTSNPIYPLYDKAFQAPSPDDSDSEVSNTSSLNHFQTRRYVYHESFIESLLIPLRIFFQGRDDDPKYFDGKLNPFLIILPFLALWKRSYKNRKFVIQKNFLLWFSILFLLIALFTTDMRIRYIAPIIPPLVVLSMMGLKRVSIAISEMVQGKLIFRFLMIFTMLFAFYINGNYIVRLFQLIDPMSFIFKKVDRDTYISRFVGEYPIIQYANQHLSNESKILCLLLGNRTYYLNRGFYLDENFFKKNSKGIYSEVALNKRLVKSGATHIILGLSTYRDWIKHSLANKEEKVFENFFNKNTKIIYEKNGYQLLEVIPKQ
jgi:hypothetical protein